MAIFGLFSTVRAQSETDMRFDAAYRYVEEVLNLTSPARKRLNAIALRATERIELADGAFAIEQVYRTKLRADGFFESHRKYIDVQVVLEGEERIEVEDIS